jgi:hypothetical protein
MTYVPEMIAALTIALMMKAGRTSETSVNFHISVHGATCQKTVIFY